MNIKRVRLRMDVPLGAAMIEVRAFNGAFAVSVELGDHIPSILAGPYANPSIAEESGFAMAEEPSVGTFRCDHHNIDVLYVVNPYALKPFGQGHKRGAIRGR